MVSALRGCLNGETWDAIRERKGTNLVAAVDRVAPGLASSVEHMHVQTPLDLERAQGLRNGQVMHVEMAFDQMVMWRPMPELAGYRAGSTCATPPPTPMTGVFGASGRSAAGAVLADRNPSPLARPCQEGCRG